MFFKDRGCPDAERCISGWCRAKCEEARECRGDGNCFNNRCLPRCQADDECLHKYARCDEAGICVVEKNSSPAGAAAVAFPNPPTTTPTTTTTTATTTTTTTPAAPPPTFGNQPAANTPPLKFITNDSSTPFIVVGTPKTFRNLHIPLQSLSRDQYENESELA